MVWKSERWQNLLEVTECADVTEPVSPQPLEITYVREGGMAQKETVYEDASDGLSPPRLIVPLSAVTALKDLCEHEHARYDQVVQTLHSCRSAYFKELRWLRDQLHLAYRSDEEAMLRKAMLTPDDFEVYWFEPPRYVDPELKEFLLECIRQTNRKLINENADLRYQIAQQNILGSGVVPTVLRQLRRTNATGVILRELYSQLRSNKEQREFQDVAAELIGQAASESPTSKACRLQAVEEDEPETGTESSSFARKAQAALASLQEELTAMKQQAAENEQLIAELRAQLAQGIDSRLERERADREQERADLIQKRAERLEQQYKALLKELQRFTSGENEDVAPRTPSQRATEERASRLLRRTASKLSEALLCLTPGNSATASPSVTPHAPHALHKPSIDEGEDDDADAGTLDEALQHLDMVASGVETVAQEVLAELQMLRAKAAIADSVQQATAVGGDASAARVAALEAQLAKEQELNAEAKAAETKLRAQLADANALIEQLQLKLAFFHGKVEKLKSKILNLKNARCQAGGAGDSDDDDDDDMNMDFLVPYRLRVAAAAGKPRWELLSEDAKFAQRRRDFLVGQRNKVAGMKAPPPLDHETVAAFSFLSSGNGGPAGHLRRLHLHPAAVPAAPQSAAPSAPMRAPIAGSDVQWAAASASHAATGSGWAIPGVAGVPGPSSAGLLGSPAVATEAGAGVYAGAAPAQASRGRAVARGGSPAPGWPVAVPAAVEPGLELAAQTGGVVRWRQERRQSPVPSPLAPNSAPVAPQTAPGRMHDAGQTPPIVVPPPAAPVGILVPAALPAAGPTAGSALPGSVAAPAVPPAADVLRVVRNCMQAKAQERKNVVVRVVSPRLERRPSGTTMAEALGLPTASGAEVIEPFPPTCDATAPCNGSTAPQSSTCELSPEATSARRAQRRSPFRSHSSVPAVATAATAATATATTMATATATATAALGSSPAAVVREAQSEVARQTRLLRSLAQVAATEAQPSLTVATAIMYSNPFADPLSRLLADSPEGALGKQPPALAAKAKNRLARDLAAAAVPWPGRAGHGSGSWSLPLTDGSRASTGAQGALGSLRASRSFPELRPEQRQDLRPAAVVDAAGGAEAFASEVLPALPPSRTLRAPPPPGWGLSDPSARGR